MAESMKRISTLLIALALPVAFAAPAIAQDGNTLGTVVNGNTTTVFKAADSRDIDTHKLKTWNEFASDSSEGREPARQQARADQ